MIKQRWLAGLSGILAIVLAGYILERLWFLQRAQRTTGWVIDVSSYDSTCGSRRHRYSCTKYTAKIQFNAGSLGLTVFSVSAGSTRGYGMPVTRASMQPRQTVPVVYDPKNPSKAYQNTFWGVWGGPVGVFFFQIMTFIGSLFNPKNRYYR